MDLPAHDLPGNRDGASLEPTFAVHPDYLYGDAAQGAGEVNQINADALGRTSDQFIRYRALTYRLVAPAEAVDPAQALDEQFSATDVVAQLPSSRPGHPGLAGAEATHFAPRRLGQSTHDATSTSALKLRCHVVKQRS